MHVGTGAKGEELKEDAEVEKTRAEAECPIEAKLPASHATETSNEDNRIEKEDTVTGTHSWIPATHEITLEANGELTLSGSKYFFCNFKATKNSRLIIPLGAKVETFIGAASEGTCGSKAGKFEGENEFIVKNESKNPASLLIMMKGKGPFALKNGSTLIASIFAPEAEVDMNGGTNFTGGIVGEKIHLENGTGIFERSEETATLGERHQPVQTRGSMGSVQGGLGSE